MGIPITTRAGRRRRYRLTILIASVICLFFYRQSFLPGSPTGFFHNAAGHTRFRHAPCPQSPLTDEILVVMRTGATEIHQRLPFHFDTTLRCVPDLVIYSDYSETIHGHQVHDVFRGVNKSLIAQQPDFAHYRHLQSQGRDGLQNTTFEMSSIRGSDNPAWKLDRFKFLPMVEETLRYRENATWYVFLEADAYLMWPTLVEFLATFDASQALYLGRQMNIGSVTFGHGGAGFMLSNAAMRKITEHRKAHLQEYDEYTAREWAGDMVLGKVSLDAGIPLTFEWPHLEGSAVSYLDFNDTEHGQTPWCHAPVTYHHLLIPEMKEFYAFEQAWRRKHATETLLYRHVFREFLLPKFGAEVEGWDNLSWETVPHEDPTKTESMEQCLAVCKNNPACFQYSYLHGDCHIATRARHGRAPKAGEEAIRSGWIVDRIVQFADEKDSTCHSGQEDKWIKH